MDYYRRAFANALEIQKIIIDGDKQGGVAPIKLVTKSHIIAFECFYKGFSHTINFWANAISI